MYHFISKKSDPIKFNHFRFPLGFIADTRNGKTELETAKQKQINFKLNLNRISTGNRKYKSREQINALDNIKIFYNSREKVIKYYDDYSSIASKAKHKANMGED